MGPVWGQFGPFLVLFRDVLASLEGFWPRFGGVLAPFWGIWYRLDAARCYETPCGSLNPSSPLGERQDLLLRQARAAAEELIPVISVISSSGLIINISLVSGGWVVSGLAPVLGSKSPILGPAEGRRLIRAAFKPFLTPNYTPVARRSSGTPTSRRAGPENWKRWRRRRVRRSRRALRCYFLSPWSGRTLRSKIPLV